MHAIISEFTVIAILRKFPMILLTDNFLSQHSLVIWKIIARTKGPHVIGKIAINRLSLVISTWLLFSLLL